MNDLLLAFDLGTTTLAARLFTPDGEVLAEGRTSNPQRGLGADIIRRLEASLAGRGDELQQLLIGGMAELLGSLLQSCGVQREEIARVALAANPGVTALLCGDDVRPILFPPHRPKNLSVRKIELPELALKTTITVFPLLSGYVGGDLVACLYSLPYTERLTLCIDLGTNGEIALGTSAGWMATSVPAGPAFEGGEIRCGQVAAAGAISNVTVQGDRLQLEVIGNGPPTGLAGSGLFAAIAAALEGGLIDRSGRILSPAEVDSNLVRYLVPDGGAQALRLYRDAQREIVVSQGDVRAFQLAKGAVRAGIEALLSRFGVTAAEVEEVVVTGAFGLSLDRKRLKNVAILPELMVEKVLFLPGAALAGVEHFLQQKDPGRRLQSLTEGIRSYPLSGTPAFERAFLGALNF